MQQQGRTAACGHDAGRAVLVRLAFDAEVARRIRIAAINRPSAGLLRGGDDALGERLEHAYSVHGEEPTSLKPRRAATETMRVQLRSLFLRPLRDAARAATVAEGLAPDDPAFGVTTIEHLARCLERAFERDWWRQESIAVVSLAPGRHAFVLPAQARRTVRY